MSDRIDPYLLVTRLDEHGDQWRDYLPEGAEIIALDDPYVYDTVRLPDGMQVCRRDGADTEHGRGEWLVLGWSDAGRARRFRPIRDSDPDTLHEGD